MTLIGCSTPTKDDQCRRKFSDAEIDKLLVQKLKYLQPHQTDVRWKDCKYYALIWWLPITPDHNTFVSLDANGNVLKPPEY